MKTPVLHQRVGTNDSKGPNFGVAETCALLEGVRGNFASIVGGFSSAKGGEVTNKGKDNIWEDITNHVNATEDNKASDVAMGEPSGQGNERPYRSQKPPNR